MRSTKELQTKVRETVRERLSLIVVSLVVLIFASTILSSVLLAPILSLSMAGTSTVLSFVLAAVAMYLSCAIIIFLVYGFSIILGRFYRGEPAVLGYMIWGFRDWKRMSLLSLFASLVIFAATFIVVVPVSVYLTSSIETVTEEAVLAEFNAFIMAIPVILLAVTAIVLPVFMPFMFSFPIMFHERGMKLFAVLKKSRALLKGRKWRLFCFAMKCALYPLITCGVCLAATFLLPEESALGSLAGLVFSVSLYYCLVYIVLAVTAYYYELADPDTLCLVGISDFPSLAMSDPLFVDAPAASDAAPSEEDGCESSPEEPNQRMW